MAIKRVFCCTLGSCSYTFAKGKSAIFTNGQFFTDVPSEIEELEKEIAAGHPHLFIDPAYTEVDTEKLDPIEIIRQKAIADYIKQQKELGENPARDMGNTHVAGEASAGIKGVQTTAGIKVGALTSNAAK